MIMTCEMNNLEIVLSLCLALMKSFVVGWAQSTNQLTNCHLSVTASLTILKVKVTAKPLGLAMERGRSP